MDYDWSGTRKQHRTVVIRLSIISLSMLGCILALSLASL